VAQENFMSYEYSLEEINKGQAKINFQLVAVDQKTISALKDILGIIKNIAAVPALAAHLRDLDVSSIEKVLDDAMVQSNGVADIIPPGCQAPPY
jgi:hypothetical protein